MSIVFNNNHHQQANLVRIAQTFHIPFVVLVSIRSSKKDILFREGVFLFSTHHVPMHFLNRSFSLRYVCLTIFSLRYYYPSSLLPDCIPEKLRTNVRTARRNSREKSI